MVLLLLIALVREKVEEKCAWASEVREGSVVSREEVLRFWIQQIAPMFP